MTDTSGFNSGKSNTSPNPRSPENIAAQNAAQSKPTGNISQPDVNRGSWGGGNADIRSGNSSWGSGKVSFDSSGNRLVDGKIVNFASRSSYNQYLADRGLSNTGQIVDQAKYSKADWSQLQGYGDTGIPPNLDTIAQYRPNLRPDQDFGYSGKAVLSPKISQERGFSQNPTIVDFTEDKSKAAVQAREAFQYQFSKNQGGPQTPQSIGKSFGTAFTNKATQSIGAKRFSNQTSLIRDSPFEVAKKASEAERASSIYPSFSNAGYATGGGSSARSPQKLSVSLTENVSVGENISGGNASKNTVADVFASAQKSNIKYVSVFNEQGQPVGQLRSGEQGLNVFNANFGGKGFSVGYGIGSSNIPSDVNKVLSEGGVVVVYGQDKTFPAHTSPIGLAFGEKGQQQFSSLMSKAGKGATYGFEYPSGQKEVIKAVKESPSFFEKLPTSYWQNLGKKGILNEAGLTQVNSIIASNQRKENAANIADQKAFASSLKNQEVGGVFFNIQDKSGKVIKTTSGQRTYYDVLKAEGYGKNQQYSPVTVTPIERFTIGQKYQYAVGVDLTKVQSSPNYLKNLEDMLVGTGRTTLSILGGLAVQGSILGRSIDTLYRGNETQREQSASNIYYLATGGIKPSGIYQPILSSGGNVTKAFADIRIASKPPPPLTPTEEKIQNVTSSPSIEGINLGREKPTQSSAYYYGSLIPNAVNIALGIYGLKGISPIKSTSLPFKYTQEGLGYSGLTIGDRYLIGRAGGKFITGTPTAEDLSLGKLADIQGRYGLKTGGGTPAQNKVITDVVIPALQKSGTLSASSALDILQTGKEGSALASASPSIPIKGKNSVLGTSTTTSPLESTPLETAPNITPTPDVSPRKPIVTSLFNNNAPATNAFDVSTLGVHESGTVPNTQAFGVQINGATLGASSPIDSALVRGGFGTKPIEALTPKENEVLFGLVSEKGYKLSGSASALPYTLPEYTRPIGDIDIMGGSPDKTIDFLGFKVRRKGSATLFNEEAMKRLNLVAEPNTRFEAQGNKLFKFTGTEPKGSKIVEFPRLNKENPAENTQGFSLDYIFGNKLPKGSVKRGGVKLVEPNYQLLTKVGSVTEMHLSGGKGEIGPAAGRSPKDIVDVYGGYKTKAFNYAITGKPKEATRLNEIAEAYRARHSDIDFMAAFKKPETIQFTQSENKSVKIGKEISSFVKYPAKSGYNIIGSIRGSSSSIYGNEEPSGKSVSSGSSRSGRSSTSPLLNVSSIISGFGKSPYGKSSISKSSIGKSKSSILAPSGKSGSISSIISSMTSGKSSSIFSGSGYSPNGRSGRSYGGGKSSLLTPSIGRTPYTTTTTSQYTTTSRINIPPTLIFNNKGKKRKYKTIEKPTAIKKFSVRNVFASSANIKQKYRGYYF